ncbi:MAG: exo-alpha-sialidase [Gemmatirosa sp.]|nr:exo-alpha-sialidase [Gemmatirosa sp.]
MTPMDARRRALALTSLALLPFALACGDDPVAWDDAAERRAPVPPPSAAQPAPDAAADSVLLATLRAAARDAGPASAAASVPSTVLDVRGRACPLSVRVAAGRAGERDAVWWALDAAGRATLLASRSGDGGATWRPAVAVDTLDVGTTGCVRPAPAVAVDSANGYVHVAYALAAPDGTGVFYAHRMGPELPFERTQVITYGDHVTPASVASAGDLVVVAYEDPNTGGRPYVSLAISRTAGHSWAERVEVSSAAENAVRPAVALRGHTVAAGWVSSAPPRVLRPDDPDAGGLSQVVVRVGRIR